MKFMVNTFQYHNLSSHQQPQVVFDTSTSSLIRRDHHLVPKQLRTLFLMTAVIQMQFLEVPANSSTSLNLWLP